jgi:hypothetical protein
LTDEVDIIGGECIFTATGPNGKATVRGDVADLKEVKAAARFIAGLDEF